MTTNLGIWIPARVADADDITWTEKILLSVIDHLDKGEGCYASNAFLAKRCGISESRLADLLTELRKKGYLIDRGTDGRRARRSVKYSARGFSPADLDAVQLPIEGNPEFLSAGTQGSRSQEPEYIDKNIDKIPPAAGRSKTPPVVFQMRDEWKARMGGEINAGRLIRALKAILDAMPSEQHEDVLAAWKQYLAVTEPRFASPERFIEKWRTYEPRQKREQVVDKYSD